MKSTTKGFLLLVFLISGLIVVWYYVAPMLEKRKETLTSDAGKIESEITIGGDSWLGYCILRSPEFKSALRKRGINPVWKDDNADYVERMRKFAEGKYSFIVATVDSYVLNAAKTEPSFPGVIVSVIDESKGGDAIVAAQTVKDINELNSPGVKIALTPASPSEFLTKAVASHFNLDSLMHSGAWKLETDGAKEAYSLLTKGKVDVAVMWEPYVSKALSDSRFHKLLGTDKTRGLIVDILIAHRSLVADSPELVQQVLAAYFRALQYYRKDEKRFEKLAAEDTNESHAVARKMLEGMEFVNFNDNCNQWFGLGTMGSISEQLSEVIDSTVNILTDNGDLKSDPLNSNPYKIINSSMLDELNKKGTLSLDSKFTVPGKRGMPKKITFKPLSDAQWNKLRMVGTLKIRPIVFQSSTALLSINGKEEVDRAAESISHYPQFRILIKGHTSPSGDEKANRELSQQRADTVRQYLVSVHDIDPARIKAVGMGSSEPLPKKSHESYRAYKLRLQRVEFIFLTEDI